MNTRFSLRWLRWLPLLVLVAWPLACTAERHSFSDEPPGESAGDAGNNPGAGAGGKTSGSGGASGASHAGRGGGSNPNGGDTGDAGASPSGGDAGETSSGGAGPGAGAGGVPGAGAGGGSSAGAGGGTPVAPTIVMVTPAPDATGVRSDQSIIVQFSVPMSKTVTQAAFDAQTVGAGMFSWSADAKTMTYKPTAALAYATGTAPASTTAKLYTYKINTTAESADGLNLAAAKTYGFSTARQIATTLYPDQTWNVNSAGVKSMCQPGECDGVTVGDNAANVGERGVLHYDLTNLPAGAFVQDVRMNISIYFANGSITTLGTLYIGKTTDYVYAATQTTAFFSFTVLPKNMTEATYTDCGPQLLSNGSLGTKDLFLSLLWSIPSDNDGAYDDIFIDGGSLGLHYLIP